MISRSFLLFLLLLSLVGKTQLDTILTKNFHLIPCTIQRIGMVSVEYIDTAKGIANLDLFQIHWYSRQGIRSDGRSRAKEIGIHKKDTVNLSEELNYLRNCLNKFHKQYTTGLSITLVGTALAASSLLVTKDPVFRQQLGIGSVLLLLAGFGCSTDAHKWIGRAGWGVSGKGNNVEIYYRFR